MKEGSQLITCVISTCRRCLMCLKHCECPERHARLCGMDSELDAEDGPFANLNGERDDGRGIKSVKALAIQNEPIS